MVRGRIERHQLNSAATLTGTRKDKERKKKKTEKKRKTACVFTNLSEGVGLHDCAEHSVGQLVVLEFLFIKRT